MEEEIQTDSENSKWDLLTQQVKAYKGFCTSPSSFISLIRFIADAVLCSVYDIPSDKRRKKVSDLLKGMGRRVVQRL